MGSKFSKKGFCATYAKHKKQKAEEATAKVSETPSTAQTSPEALAWIENQSPTQTMEVSEQDHAAQATEETEAARDSETQPLAEMSEGPTGKTEPQLAAQITTENETCSIAEYMQDTDGAQPAAQTGQLTVRDQFAQTMEETGSQANIQTAQETVLSLASAETKQVTPENAVESILQDTSMVSRVCRVPEENVLQSMNHSSDSTMQERQPTVRMTQKMETLYGEKTTELKNVQCQQNVKHPRVPSALTENKAKEGNSLTTEEDQAPELEATAVVVHEQKQDMEKLSFQEAVSTSTAGTDAPVNPVLGRQEVDSQLLEASVPEMHKSRGEEETANPWTLSAPETQGSEREVVPASGPRSSNNEAALDSGESQTTEETDSLCVCRSYSPSRRANFICCCSN
ncbi:uro-adherence factor A-like [Emydura macquarii macquarii]|uniref:uro-adherence factor A-like n=1 Tax=Emydura macquarii macquarii TaxID=1129001 RepID=UPI00352B31B0